MVDIIAESYTAYGKHWKCAFLCEKMRQLYTRTCIRPSLTVNYCFTLRKKRIGCYKQDRSWVMITYQLVMGPAVKLSPPISEEVWLFHHIKHNKSNPPNHTLNWTSANPHANLEDKI